MNHPPLGDIALTTPAGFAGAQLDGLMEELVAQHPEADIELVRHAHDFADARHEGQTRQSGEPYITHPLGVARIAAGLGLDAPTIAAALLHDTVEDTGATLAEIESQFGDGVAALVDGVTKLSKIHFESKEEAQAENYRKLIISMSSDIRVLLIKLCDRLHNMRTLGYLAKAKQVKIARETLEIYAPLAHRLGVHSIKWELEDLAFSALLPKRFTEIQQMVNQRRGDREEFVNEAGSFLREELAVVGIAPVDITGRAKHFYSIYEKMTRKGKEFNEIYDLTAMRVLVDSVKDCYGAVGIVHSIWKPMPGRFKDYIAVPKANGYQSIHTTVIGPHGKPLEIQIRTHEMHLTAEFGIAAHWRYKKGVAGDGPGSQEWLARMMDWQRDTKDPGEFLESFRSDLHQEEVYVFTPKGEVRALAAGATPLDFAYEIHTDVGHRCVGAKVNGRIVPLSYTLTSGDFVEVLTSNTPRGPSRDWVNLVTTGKARSKIRQFFLRERREDAEHTGRDMLQEQLKKAGLPSQKMVASPLLHQVITEMGFRKAEDFYISLGMSKTSVHTVVNKVIARLKAGQAVAEEPPSALVTKAPRARSAAQSTDLGVEIEGLSDVMARMARCCKPVPGDDIVGYISLGRGITIHRAECPNVKTLARAPERFTPVSWVGSSRQSFRVEVAVDAWDRVRLLEDLSRTLSENGANIVMAHCQGEDQMVRNRFTVELGDVSQIKGLIAALRAVEGVFDAYRVGPGR